METLNRKKKSSRGRQKIEIKKIKNEAARQVAFAKRRQGIMKKASELSILCGAEYVIVAFSPAGKPFSFGHPSVDSITARFLEQGTVVSDDTQQAADWHLNLHYMELERQMEAAMRRKGLAEDRLRAAVARLGDLGRALEKEEMEGMSVESLEGAKRLLDDARITVEVRQQELLFAAAAAAVPTKMSAVAVAARPVSIVLSSVKQDEVKQFEGGKMVAHSFNSRERSF